MIFNIFQTSSKYTFLPSKKNYTNSMKSLKNQNDQNSTNITDIMNKFKMYTTMVVYNLAMP